MKLQNPTKKLLLEKNRKIWGSGFFSIFALTLFSGLVIAQPSQKPCLDFYGTGRTSLATIGTQGNNQIWRLRNNGGVGEDAISWGFADVNDDLPSAGYYDNDNKTDIAVVRRTGSNYIYYIRPSTQTGALQGINWGLRFDYNASEGDYDGDGRDDLTAVRNVSDQWHWYYLRSSNNTLGAIAFGIATQFQDIPMHGADYNGDGRDDITVLRRNGSGGETYFAGDSQTGALLLAQQWGETDTDSYIIGDYVGDQRADFAVWRASENGTWFIKENGGSQIIYARFGQDGDTPICGDYNGDGKSDIAVYRNSTSTFYWLNSPNNNSFGGLQFGQPGDLPVAAIRNR